MDPCTAGNHKWLVEGVLTMQLDQREFPDTPLLINQTRDPSTRE
jgi:hypothetical protein